MKHVAEIAIVAIGLLLAPVMMPAMPTVAEPGGVLAGLAYAVQPDEVLPDAALETRARSLSEGLRCLVCQNQSIDESDAPLAKDLRVLVRERLVAGDSDRAVIDYIVARYGEFVLLQPRLSIATLLLWGTPALLILAGVGFAYVSLRRRRRETLAPRLSAEEEIAVARMLDERGL